MATIAFIAVTNLRRLQLGETYEQINTTPINTGNINQKQTDYIIYSIKSCNLFKHRGNCTYGLRNTRLEMVSTYPFMKRSSVRVRVSQQNNRVFTSMVLFILQPRTKTLGERWRLNSREIQIYPIAERLPIHFTLAVGILLGENISAWNN